MHTKLFLFGTWLIFISPHLHAQQQPYIPLRTNEKIILDGKLTEAAWKLAAVENDFMQYDPSAGAAPTERSEVRIVYNDDYLFIGLRAFDSEPTKLIANALERDFALGNDDGFGLVIDSYNDKSTGLSFIANLLNARWDTEFSGNGENENANYNTFWDVASNVDSSGYSTEFRIPFSSLRFQTKDTVLMGFRVVRLIKRKNELDMFPKLPASIDNAYLNVSLAREMKFTSLKSKKPFYIIPYAIANYSQQNVLNENGTAYKNNGEFMTRKNYVNDKTPDKLLSNIGLDVKYGLSKNFTLDATLNTDFAQFEVDNLIVNLTKYDVNLPEKRSFFLESQDYLSYTTSLEDELFVSRSIGIENGEVVPIIAGARITGKSNDWQMGSLDMETSAIKNDSISAHNFFAFRTRKFFDSLGSFFGGIFTNKINTSGNGASFQSIGVQGVKVFNPNLSLLANVSGTFQNTNTAKFSQHAYYNIALIQTVKEGWNYRAELSLIGKDFEPAMGFVQENDLGNIALQGGYIWKAKEKSSIAYFHVQAGSGYKWKPFYDKEESKFINSQTGIDFKNGAQIIVTPLKFITDTLFEVFDISDHIHLPQKKYNMFSPEIQFTLPQMGNYWGQQLISWGDLYGGKRLSLTTDLTYVFNKHFRTQVEYEYDHIQFPDEYADNGNGLFQSNLVSLNLSYFLSSRVSIKWLTQLNNLDNRLTSNLRFRYNPREGTDLYIVFNQNLNSDRARLNPHLPVINTQAFTIKFLKTFDML